MLNVARIRAISIDLDDTLWPIWPTIERAEGVLHAWLQAYARQTAALRAVPGSGQVAGQPQQQDASPTAV